MSKSNYYKERVIQLLLFFAFMLPMGALAQNIQLNGTVTDVSDESVIGASVLEKGTTNGVITDIDQKPLLLSLTWAMLHKKSPSMVARN